MEARSNVGSMGWARLAMIIAQVQLVLVVINPMVGGLG